MSSDLPRTPSIIMNRAIARDLNSMFRAAPGTSFPLPSSGSPRFTMANTEDADPGEEQQKRTKTLHAVSVPASVFTAADKELLKSGKYADAKVVANGKTYAVHKNVVCTRSKWFRKVLEGAFREGQESVVEISADDNIERVLEFLYTGAVDLTKDTDLMASANELSVLGDFYLSNEMNDYAKQVLVKYLGEYLKSICDVNTCPDLPAEYDTAEYRDFLLDPTGAWPLVADSRYHGIHQNFSFLHDKGFVDRLCNAIRGAYATPSGMQRVYVDFVYTARIHTFGCLSIRNLRDEIPEFGHDLLTAVMTGPLSSAFQGNPAFEQWKDPFANPQLVSPIKQSQSRGNQKIARTDRNQYRAPCAPWSLQAIPDWAPGDYWG